MINEKYFDKYTIDKDESILNALKKMDMYSAKTLIVRSELQVVGTLTDGDVRRSLIRGYGLGDKVFCAMNDSFVFLMEGDKPQKIIDVFQNEAIGIVPILNQSKQLKNVMTRHAFEEMIISKNNVTTDFDLSMFDASDVKYSIISRPWGFYKTIILNELFQSKVIYVFPDQSLSLQSHMRREEYWTIINGKGKVQLDESIRWVCPGDTVFIPKGCKHRITNYCEGVVLILSEIQLGDYFGEDDIMRYDDIYGRC